LPHGVFSRPAADMHRDVPDDVFAVMSPAAWLSSRGSCRGWYGHTMERLKNKARWPLFGARLPIYYICFTHSARAPKSIVVWGDNGYDKIR